MRSEYRLRRSSSGFTLIELLIAISILAMIAVLGWRGLDGIIRSRQALNQEMEQSRGIQLAFAQIENDCAHLMDASLLPGQSVLSAGGNKLMLIRAVSDDAQPTRYQVVVYSVVDAQLSRRELPLTRELRRLRADWELAMSDGDGTTPIVLQKDVQSIQMRTWKTGETGWRSGGDDIQNPSQVLTNPAFPAITGPKSAKLAGLELTLQLISRPAPMVKVFLLGAA
ncbi:PulJ/GspJ family protein [Undibacterium squillarum]|uniref:General secretion pathway protein GspJ n=1 Tax=Undibacterium squillarum TaxID=1131567 RepID=A0ABQ2Y1A2_9BURK|nr:prepilin-type N-terminal cleavage/methylation domain-containing protein [Undibacterium squillarum]GGX49624.1 general secretion pathway protein GspJ [Undibacterium squillarum]